MKILCVYVLILITCELSLNATSDQDSISVKNIKLLDSEVVGLEEKVIDYLKNSWCSAEKAKLLFELVITVQPKICVEIGACTGSSTLPMVAALKYLNQGRAYIIDAWSNQEAIKGLPLEDPNTIWWGQLDMDALRNQFNYTMNQWSLNSYFQVLHMTSKEASYRLETIDFLHIDGNFSEEGALQDSLLYLPKVTSGGYILLSNVLVMIGKQPTKMKALWPLFEYCDIVSEIENGNALLFYKK
jgi:hypothetical protein